MTKNKTFLLTLSGLALTTIHILNRMECAACLSKNILPTNAAKLFEWRFGNISYRVSGSGAPLLLIHDLTPGSSSYEFSRIEGKLTKTNTVYSVDLLGYGFSDKPNITYTNYLYVQMITDFIKKVIGKKTSIVSTGSSAISAIMAVHNNPDMIDKLVLIHPQDLYQGNQIPSTQSKILKCLIDMPIIGTFVYNLHTSRNALETQFQYEYLHRPIENMEDVINAYAQSAHVDSGKGRFAYSSYITKYTNTNCISALKSIDNSILLISGKESSFSETNEGNYIYFNRSIEAVRIPDSKNLPQLENPAETNARIQEFLS